MKYINIIILVCLSLSACIHPGMVPDSRKADKTALELPGSDTPKNPALGLPLPYPEEKPEKQKLQKPLLSKKPGEKNKEKFRKKSEAKTEKKERPLPARKVNMNMQDVELTLLFRTLAKIENQSIILSENVKGKTSISVNDKPWDQLFLGLLKTYSLSYSWEGDIIRITTIEDLNRDVQRLVTEEKKKSKQNEIEQAEPMQTKVIHVNFADGENLRRIFDQLLTDGVGHRQGHIMLDQHSNALVIRARPRDIEQISKLAEELDKPVYQVRIEARIIETSNDIAHELGVEWGGRYTFGGSRYRLGSSVTDISNSEDSDQSNSDDLSDKNPNDSILDFLPGMIQSLPAITSQAQDAGLLLGLIAKGRSADSVLGIQLAALEREGKINILSSPSISTLDNQTAMIESGREVPYQTVEDDEVNVEFKKAALRLEVTPHIIGNNILKMKIITHKDELDFSNVINGNPTVQTKRAETSILLRDGQTTVIGGLRRENDTITEEGVPILKDIPLLGRLFRRDGSTNIKEEILIFITPRIIPSP